MNRLSALRRLCGSLLFFGACLWLRAWAAEPPPVAGTVPTNAPSGLPPVVPLSLTNVLSADENKDWLSGSVWQAVPRGRTNDFAGVRVWMEGLIRLRSITAVERSQKFREAVTIPVPATRTNWQTLHLLGGVADDGETAVKVADVVWRYADGTVRHSPLQSGIHFRDWWGPRYEDPRVVADKHSKAVWHGEHDDVRRLGRFLRLYLISLANPETNRVLKSLELVSAKTRATPFFLGLSLDILPRGTRAPDFMDLDDRRPGFTAAQFVTVTEAESGQPVAGAEVVAFLREAAGTDVEAQIRHTVKTDKKGLAILPKGAKPLDSVMVTVRADDYTTAAKTLDAKKDGPIPANFEVKLKRGLLIGGVVLDPDGNPLAATRIQLSQMWRNDPEFQKRMVPDLPSVAIVTDAEGRWQTKQVPAEVLPDLIVIASHPDHLAPYGGVIGEDPSAQARLKALKHEIRMLRGGDVTGVVLGPDEQPLAGALVSVGHQYDQSSRREMTTGADGRFLLRNVRPQLQPVTATAPGYGPASKSVTATTNTVEVTLQLKPSRKLAGVVLNPEGLPVEGAEVRYDPQDWEERQRLNVDWRATTDANGQFEWADAPDRELEVTVFKSGYASKNSVKIKPGDEVNIIRLTRTRKVLGVVGNEETGGPVTRFSVQWAEGDERNLYRWSDSDRNSFEDAEGHFTLDLNDERHNVIRVEADDFEPRQMRLPTPENDHVQVVVLLKPSPTPSGIVVNPAGEPLPGVTVALTDSQLHTELARGQLVRHSGGGLQKTDAQGRFKLRPTLSPGRVVAVSDAGYGEVSWVQFQQTGTVVLQPWGRVEGTVFAKGKPVAGRRLLLSLQRPGAWDSFHAEFNSYQSTSDDEGRFTIEKVPAATCAIVQLLQTSPNSWLHANPTPIEVRPGETTRVEIGNRGATVSGRIDAGNLAAGKTGVQFMVTLGTPFPTPPDGLKGQAEVAAWQQSEAFKEAFRQHRNYNAVPEADGSFQFEGVEPGSYTLNASADWPKPEGKSWERDQLGHVSVPLLVPGENGNPVSTVEIGTLALKPTAPPAQLPEPATGEP